MRKYKARLRSDIYITVVCVILIAATILFSSNVPRASWTVIIVFLLGIILTNIFSNRIIEIQVDESNRYLTLIYGNYLKTTKNKTYDLQRIEFTYKRQATSLKGGVRSVCTVYYEDKKIARLIPSDDGWTNDEIRGFVNELIQLQVPKKFIGYNLKDVET